MVIETKEYRIDPATHMRAGYRTMWLRAWPFVCLLTLGAVLMLATGQVLTGIVVIGIGLGLPFYTAQVKVKRAINSPLAQIGSVVRFDESGMETLVVGERKSLLRYDEIQSADVIPEGIRIWIHKGIWLFLPKAAFENESDFETTCSFFVQAGKMKAKTK